MASPTARVLDAALEPASAVGDVRYVQLGSGRDHCRRVVARTACARISFEAWSLGVLKMGRAPRGFVTFLVPVARGGSPRVKGRRLEAGDVVVLFDGAEIDYRSSGPSQLVTVSIERAALERHVRTAVDRHLGELRLQGRLNGLRTDPTRLRALCLALAPGAEARPRLLRDPARAEGLEAKLVEVLFSNLEAMREAEAPSRGRALALRAEAWLRQNLAESPTIATLCEALGASERTLHEAFRQHLDSTPKAYLKTLRLNAARHRLLEGRAGTRVTDVALDWGFVHFGWFSQDYRRQFGETPSQTLQRGRRSAVPPATLRRIH